LYDDDLAGPEFCDHWAQILGPDDSDLDDDTSDKPSYLRLEDSDDESDSRLIDWDAIEIGFSPSAWDQLGKSYKWCTAVSGFLPLEFPVQTNTDGLS
jgi:hypothetical protein